MGPSRLSSADAPAPGPAALDAGGSAPRGLQLAHVISLVCLPPLLAMATFVALCSQAIPDPRGAARVALVSSLFVAIGPSAYVAFLLKRHKINGGVDLENKEERLRPYLVGAGSCVLGLLVLMRLSAPRSVTVLALSYATNALVLALITQRWKISAHAAGAAMPLTALLNAFGVSALPLAVVVPVVCWARVRSQMHTVTQVCAGALVGFLLTWTQSALLD